MRPAPITAAPAKIFDKFGHLHETALFYAMTGLLGLICITWSMPASVLYYCLPRRAGTRLGQGIIMRGFRFYLGCLKAAGLVRCDLSELDALNREAGLVIAPNHPSLIDVLLVTSRLPRITGIMKAEIRENVFLAGGARLARYIRNDSARTLVKRATEEIQRGSQLLVFPEGTRTVRHPVNPFKGGFALIAKQAGVAVQTVFIESNTQYLHKGWPLFKRPPLPLEYRVRLGQRFYVGADVKKFTEELEQYFRVEIDPQVRAVPAEET
ncbi:MAG: lysophospholipid acyltransferase family protein [Burkholderiales bacterium]